MVGEKEKMSANLFQVDSSREGMKTRVRKERGTLSEKERERGERERRERNERERNERERNERDREW